MSLDIQWNPSIEAIQDGGLSKSGLTWGVRETFFVKNGATKKTKFCKFRKKFLAFSEGLHCICSNKPIRHHKQTQPLLLPGFCSFRLHWWYCFWGTVKVYILHFSSFKQWLIVHKISFLASRRSVDFALPEYICFTRMVKTGSQFCCPLFSFDNYFRHWIYVMYSRKWNGTEAWWRHQMETFFL